MWYIFKGVLERGEGRGCGCGGVGEGRGERPVERADAEGDEGTGFSVRREIRLS